MFRLRNQLFLLLFFILFQAHSQNLVPNSSFENLNHIPCLYVNGYTEFSYHLQDWTLPTYGTSDVFTALSPTNCFANPFSTHPEADGKQAPRTGNNMCGISTYNAGLDYREYIQVKLTSTLIVGEQYYAEMYVSGAEYGYLCNNIGMHFSNKEVTPIEIGHHLVLEVIPQIKSTDIISDTEHWVKISGRFTATAAVEYMIIGNFDKDNNTSIIKNNTDERSSYYYIDDVLVKPVCDPTDVSLAICKGSSITLQSTERTIVSWALADSPAAILSNTPTLLVSPEIATRYIATYACGETSVFEVIIDPLPTFDLGKDTAICTGQKIELDATTEHATYLWQDGSTKPDYTVTKTGVYSVTVKNACGSFKDQMFVQVDAPLVFNLGTDTTICKDEVIHFDATTGGASYLWQDGSTHPTYTIRNPGYYAVTIKNSCGTKSENLTLHICCEGAEIPNLITPNGDGKNETFYIDCYGNGDYELNIYNQWGSLVYQNKAYLNNWAGNDVSDGIYYFVLTFLDKKIHNGWVHVLR